MPSHILHVAFRKPAPQSWLVSHLHFHSQNGDSSLGILIRDSKSNHC